LILRRRNACDAEDRSQDDRLTEQREESRRYERETVEREADPEAPLEEVVLLDDRSL
jgi:hypothetical protein